MTEEEESSSAKRLPAYRWSLSSDRCFKRLQVFMGLGKAILRIVHFLPAFHHQFFWVSVWMVPCFIFPWNLSSRILREWHRERKACALSVWIDKGFQIFVWCKRPPRRPFFLEELLSVQDVGVQVAQTRFVWKKRFWKNVIKILKN